MFNAKDEEIRELLVENNELWEENTRVKNKIFQAIEYIKSQQVIFQDCDIVVDNQLKNILEILGDKE